MAFHKSNLGSFGEHLTADMNGYVPEETDGPWDLQVDHAESTHDANGNLTEYGEWWEDEGFPEWQEAAIKATKEVEEGLAKWQESN